MKYSLKDYHWYTSQSGKSEIYSTRDKVTAHQIAKKLKGKGFSKVSVKLEHTKSIARHYIITATR